MMRNCVVLCTTHIRIVDGWGVEMHGCIVSRALSEVTFLILKFSIQTSAPYT